MAFALKLPLEVTRMIDAMYDLRLERVLRDGGTPSRLVLSDCLMEIDPPHPEYTCEVEGNEFVITECRRGLSCVSYYPNIAVYEIIGLWCLEERQVVDVIKFHEPMLQGWGRYLNPPYEYITTRLCVETAE